MSTITYRLDKYLLKRLISVWLIGFLVIGQPILVSAAGPTGSVGPANTPGISTNEVGHQGQVGPANPLGPTTPVGPQSPVGPQGQTGPIGSQLPTTSSANQSTDQTVSSNPSGQNSTGHNSSPSSTPSTQSTTSTATNENTDQPLPAAHILAPVTSTATNSDTGSQSDNQSSVTENSQTAVTEKNRSNIQNNISAQIDTGQNITNSNTGSGGIEAGQINGSVNVINSAGSQVKAAAGGITQQNIGNSTQDIIIGDPTSSDVTPLSAIVLGSLSGGGSASNTTTGQNSVNLASVERVGQTTIRVSNDAKIDNNIKLAANTGDNQASMNTGIGNIVTGSIGAAVNIINFLNTYLATDYLGLAFLNVVGALAGDIIIPSDTIVSNSSTGAGSGNNASISKNNQLTLAKESDLKVTNNVDVNATTGNNQADGNTLGGSVTSGQTDVDIQSATITGEIPADSLLLVVVNELGDGQWTGQVIGAESENVIVLVQKAEPATLIASNANTGAQSENTTTVNENTSTTITESSTSQVNNNITVDASTGNNQANYNTGGGNIKTGNINVAANMVNLVNTSGKTFKKVVIAMINVFGKWTGNLVFGSKKPQVVPSPKSSSDSISNVLSGPTPEPKAAMTVALAQPSSTSAATESPDQTVTPTSTAQDSQAAPSTSPTQSTSEATKDTTSLADPVSQPPAKKMTQPVKLAKNLSLAEAVTTTPVDNIIQSTTPRLEQPTDTASTKFPAWAYPLIVIAAGLIWVLIAYFRKSSEPIS